MNFGRGRSAGVPYKSGTLVHNQLGFDGLHCILHARRFEGASLRPKGRLPMNKGVLAQLTEHLGSFGIRHPARKCQEKPFPRRPQFLVRRAFIPCPAAGQRQETPSRWPTCPATPPLRGVCSLMVEEAGAACRSWHPFSSRLLRGKAASSPGLRDTCGAEL